MCYFTDSLHDKPDNWNEIEQDEEITNNVPGKKLSYLEKATALRYTYYHVQCY